jgi:hypothetical protein
MALMFNVQSSMFNDYIIASPAAPRMAAMT